MDQASNRDKLAQKLRLGTAVSYALFAALIALFVYWSFIRSIGFNVGILALQTLPLIALLPGIIQRAYRSYSWLCFILLFYFIFAVQLVLTSDRQTSDVIFIVLIVLLFISSMMTSRWLQRYQKSTAAESSQE